MNEIKVLDHGYVRLVESWGSDERIIEAARMSTNKGFLGWGPKCSKCGHGFCEETGYCDMYPLHCTNGESVLGDEKLLRFLYENKHATPFEMAGMTIEVQAPIFVFREWHRHRTQSYNEMSARYTTLPDVNYIPTIDRLMMNAGSTNKQASTISEAEAMTKETAYWFQNQLGGIYERDERLYQSALQLGVSKELARVILPVGRYSRMMASTDLRNWLGFLTLRMASNAMWEIRQYAYAVSEFIAQAFPRTWELYDGKDSQ